MARSAPTKT